MIVSLPYVLLVLNCSQCSWSDHHVQRKCSFSEKTALPPKTTQITMQHQVSSVNKLKCQQHSVTSQLFKGSFAWNHENLGSPTFIVYQGCTVRLTDCETSIPLQLWFGHLLINITFVMNRLIWKRPLTHTKNNLHHASSSKLLQELLLSHATPQSHRKENQWCYLLGTPDTSRNGRNTRKALSALTSNPAPFPPIEFPPSALVACSKIALKSLQKERGSNL